ncbi:MAG: hypothetical protein D3903_16855 [Candidatus Electrothrix sp. GM3_4]|nr:hypothetical protein [Candidatus Electrothrix sp. GM3_4]
MEKLKFKNSPVEKAISDFLRAGQSRLKLLSYEPTTLVKTLDEYDATILECVESKKDYWAEQLETNEIGSEKAVKFSKDLYNESINKQELIKIPDVKDTSLYYQKGRMHHNVNEKLFSWDFIGDDLN